MYTDPVILDFKNFFVRDFPYGITMNDVMDSDIQRGINEAKLLINPGLCSSQAFYTQAYLLLSAHRLVMNLRTSSKGIAAKFAWLQGSKGVGSVSESLQIPQCILDNPNFSYYSASSYGVEYLMLILPMLSGSMYSVASYTKP
jgi:hypothetical protein